MSTFERTQGTSRQRLFLFSLLVALSCAAPLTAGDGELLIKAGFITKFPSFVTWPEEDPPARHRPFSLCVLGSSPIRPQLEAVASLSGLTGGRPEVRTAREPSDAAGCRLLFIPDASSGLIDDILRKFGARPMLLVADTPGAARRGVHINLYRSGDRVRFEVNRAAFRRSGLAVSFRLLEMARIVE